MQRKSLFISVIVMFLVNVGVVALAQAGPGRGNPDGLLRQFSSARIQARLNLTPDQLKQIQEIVQAHRPAQPIRGVAPLANAAQERQALMKAIFTDNPNQAEIDKRVAALSEQANAAAQQHQQRLNQMVGALREINQVLTPEQRAEFQKMLDENARAGQIMRRRMLLRQGMNPRRPGAAQPAPPPPPPPADF